MSTRLDAVTLEVLWTRIISIVDEAAKAIVRTSFSTLSNEANDFACVLTDARGGALAQLPDDKRVEAEQQLAEIDKQFPPPPRANVKDFVDHIDYITKKIGIDHVGISSDFDGGGGIDGWNDASETFNVTLELVRRGYTEDQIAKIWSGNLLRVMEQVRQVAVKLQK